MASDLQKLNTIQTVLLPKRWKMSLQRICQRRVLSLSLILTRGCERRGRLTRGMSGGKEGVSFFLDKNGHKLAYEKVTCRAPNILYIPGMIGL